MDQNEISFEALFKCGAFKRYESPEFKEAFSELYCIMDGKLSDFDTRDKIEVASNICCSAAHRSGFEQGFRFAVKLMRALNNI